MLGAILVTVYVVACLFLVLVVLLQAGKGGGMGVALGGGASSVFGGRGAVTFLTRLTGVMAGLFMVLSVGLSLHMSGGQQGVDPNLVLEEEKGLATEEAEALPVEEKKEAAPAEAPKAEEKKADEKKADEAAKPAEGAAAPAEKPADAAAAPAAAGEKPAEKPAEAAAAEKPAEAAPAAAPAAPAEKPAN